MTVLCVLLSLICLSDYRKSRIPNSLILLILLYGLGYRYWDAGGGGVGSFAVSFFAVLLCMYPLFKIGAVGAGDVKLYASAAGYLSGRTCVRFLFYSLLIAAVFSIVKICRDRSGRERMGYLCSYLADVCRKGCWKLYFGNCAEARKAGICLSGPALVSVLLHLGGVY